LEVNLDEHPRATVLGLSPGTEFDDLLEINLGASYDLDLHGSFHPPDAQVVLTGISEGLPEGGGKIEVSASSKVATRLWLKVLTSRITSMGVGDRRFQWLLTRRDRPLVGDQLLTAAILVPRDTGGLEMSVNAFATVAHFRNAYTVPVKLVDSKRIQVKLPDPDDQIANIVKARAANDIK
jgi:hypothetical protein